MITTTFELMVHTFSKASELKLRQIVCVYGGGGGAEGLLDLDFIVSERHVECTISTQQFKQQHINSRCHNDSN